MLEENDTKVDNLEQTAEDLEPLTGDKYEEQQRQQFEMAEIKRLQDLKQKEKEDESFKLCPVCGEPSTGLHYGVYTCEGCKGFFKRHIQQQRDYPSCEFPDTHRVKHCKSCRLRRCIEAGMAHQGRSGRKKKSVEEPFSKAEILAEMATRSRIQAVEAIQNENKTLLVSPLRSSVSKEKRPNPGHCEVCRHAVAGYNYGIFSCEGCKGFFRRSVYRNETYKPCTNEGNCRENIRACQECRMKQCIRVGMVYQARKRPSLQSSLCNEEEGDNMPCDQSGDQSGDDADNGTKKPKNVNYCLVCGELASGVHYGVFSCEGCKCFFRRSIVRNTQYSLCRRPERCRNTTKCQDCRLKKCFSVGMSPEAIQWARGRRPRSTAKKLQVILPPQMDELYRSVAPDMSTDRDNSKSQSDQTQNSHFIAARYDNDVTELKDRKNVYYDAKTLKFHKLIGATEVCEKEQNPITVSSDDEEPRANTETEIEILEYHSEAESLLDSFLEAYRVARSDFDDFCLPFSCEETTRITTEIACKELMTRYLHAIMHYISSLAHSISAFKNLPMEDQILVLNTSILEIAVILHSSYVKVKKDEWIDDRLKFSVSFGVCGKLGLLADVFSEMRAVVEKLQRIKLSTSELALLSAMVLLSPDREGFSNKESLNDIQRDIVDILKRQITENHSDAKLFACIEMLCVDMRTVTIKYLNSVLNITLQSSDSLKIF